MLRRDRITIGVLGAMVALNLAVCALACFLFLRVQRRTKSALDDFESRVSSAERACADACGVALALADETRDSSFDTDSPSYSAPKPKVLGYGMSRSVGARYPYVDLQYPSGDTQRHYLARIPLEGAGAE